MSVRVGVVGLGIMGSGMADNLLAKGHEVGVYNRTATRMQRFVDAGATAHPSAAEAVLFGDLGVAAGIRTGSLVIDASTISPEATRAFAARLAEQGVAFVD